MKDERTLKTSRNIIEEFIKHYGLDNFLIETNWLSFKNGLNIGLYTDIDRNECIEMDKFIKAVDNVFKPIENSPFMNNYKKAVKEELSTLHTKIDELNKENERLKQFELYYNMQYDMTHGKINQSQTNQ